MKTKNILCEECHGMGFISMVGKNSAWSERCNKCNGAGNIEVPITNFDKITESVESLTKWICENYGKMIPECVPCKATIKVCEFQCDDCLIEWLHQEAEDEDI